MSVLYGQEDGTRAYESEQLSAFAVWSLHPPRKVIRLLPLLTTMKAMKSSTRTFFGRAGDIYFYLRLLL